MAENFEIEEADIEECAKKGLDVPHARKFRVRIDDHAHVVEGAIHDREFLLSLVGKNSEEFELVEGFANPDENEVVEKSIKVDLRMKGLKGFVTAHRHHVPKIVVIKIDEKEYKVNEGPTTGAKLRSLPPVPDDRDLWLERKGDDEKITPDAIVDVRDHMCFYTAPSTINPGAKRR